MSVSHKSLAATMQYVLQDSHTDGRIRMVEMVTSRMNTASGQVMVIEPMVVMA